jgi:hypothetical protein
MAENQTENNLLDYIPIQSVDWEKKEDGTVFVKKPKLKSQFLLRIIRRFGYGTHYSVHLDDFGSHVWVLCDGNHSVMDIANSLKDTFGDSIEPVYERLGAFVRTLAQQRLIEYKGISNSQS